MKCLYSFRNVLEPRIKSISRINRPKINANKKTLFFIISNMIRKTFLRYTGEIFYINNDTIQFILKIKRQYKCISAINQYMQISFTRFIYLDFVLIKQTRVNIFLWF